MAVEPDLDPAPSRAAQVLDQLLRQRSSAGDLGGGPDGVLGAGHAGHAGHASPGRLERPLARRRPGAVRAAVALAAAVAAVVVVFVVLDRPSPIEQRLPLAGTDPTGADASGGAAPSGSGGAADTTASGGSNGPDDAATDTDAEVVVHVAGAVTAPGVVRLRSGSRVVDAVTSAGGLRADADPDRVNLAATLVDGQRVVVPVVGQPLPVEVTPAPSSSPMGAGPADGPAAGTVVDLNTATAEQLDALPGVGPSTAAAILDHRASSGPFASVDELLDVRGIGEAKLEALRDLVSVGG